MTTELAMNMIVKIGEMRMETDGRRWSVWIRIDSTLVCAVDTNDSLEFVGKVKAAAALCDGAPDAKAADISARRMVVVATEWGDEHADA
jgi:hypothetical protein